MNLNTILDRVLGPTGPATLMFSQSTPEQRLATAKWLLDSSPGVTCILLSDPPTDESDDNYCGFDDYISVAEWDIAAAEKAGATSFMAGIQMGDTDHIEVPIAAVRRVLAEGQSTPWMTDLPAMDPTDDEWHCNGCDLWHLDDVPTGIHTDGTTYCPESAPLAVANEETP